MIIKFDNLLWLGEHKRAIYLRKMSTKKEPKELFTKILGKRIKAIREEQNKSILDVAYALQIEPNSLRRYEKGETLMNAYYLIKLAEILNVSVEKLVSDIF